MPSVVLILSHDKMQAAHPPIALFLRLKHFAYRMHPDSRVATFTGLDIARYRLVPSTCGEWMRSANAGKGCFPCTPTLE